MGCFPKAGSAITLNHHENSKADLFLEFITAREAHHCRIQVPLFPFQGTKSLHLPTQYILTSTIYYEDGLEILVGTDFSTLVLARVR